MKIRIRDHARLDAARMAKVALSVTPRSLLDLYCVAPGQSQKAHTHDAQDKIYYVVQGAGRFTLGDVEERLAAGEALVAPAGVAHGLENDGTEPLLILVVVAPPPPHGPAAAGPGRPA